ncbi:MAG: hypothetical protein IPG85_08435 [Bacteroidetes bacterium]|nr:hypothetical protein [Bacteroidota bacterium]
MVVVAQHQTGIVVGQPASIVFNTVNLHEVYCLVRLRLTSCCSNGATGGILFSITPNATQVH